MGGIYIHANRIAVTALAVAILGLSGAFRAAVVAGDSDLPAVGEKARDFELADLHGNQQKLSGLIKNGPVVLLVLRGFPGYQCPICNFQVGQYVAGNGLAPFAVRVTAGLAARGKLPANSSLSNAPSVTADS